MPQGRLRRARTAHTGVDLDLAHPVDGRIGRTDTGRVTASLSVFEPGER